MKKILLFTIVLSVIIIGALLFVINQGTSEIINSNSKKITVSFPLVYSVANNTSFACDSLISASIIGSPEEYLTNGIEGEIIKGTDTIAMNIINEDTLSFLTGASVKVGESQGDEFRIIQNDKDSLIAIFAGGGSNPFISTVVMNKNNGLAVWQKGNPDFITYDTPFGNMVYMVCK